MRIAALIVALATAAPALAASLPAHVGQCATTTIKIVGTRLEDGAGKPVVGSGSAVIFVNGGSQVSYEEVAAIDRSRPGDPVRLCLVSIPKHCPPGDDRGRFYKATNLRTGKSWTLPDSEHMCGGA